MPDFPNLPAILKWEISLAVIVLAWSLLSLGRYERLKRRWSARRVRDMDNVIRLPSATVQLSETVPARPPRLKALLLATGFATLAASFAYAMPNIVTLEEDAQRPRRAGGLNSPERRPAALAGREGHDSPASSASNATTGEPERGEGAEDSVAAGELDVSVWQPQAVEVQSSRSSGEPSALAPTPEPAVASSPTPSPPPTPSPEPTPTVTATPEPPDPGAGSLPPHAINEEAAGFPAASKGTRVQL